LEAQGAYRREEEGWVRADISDVESRSFHIWARKQQDFRDDPLNDDVKHVTTLAEALDAEAAGQVAVMGAAEAVEDEDAAYEEVRPRQLLRCLQLWVKRVEAR
jgi:hypothetical protein